MTEKQTCPHKSPDTLEEAIEIDKLVLEQFKQSRDNHQWDEPAVEQIHTAIRLLRSRIQWMTERLERQI